MKMIDMKKEGSNYVQPAMNEAYPYGLQIHLDSETMEKLGMSEPMQVGEYFMVMAKCKVCASSAYAKNDDDASLSASLQIVEMGVGKTNDKKPQEKLYSSKES